MPGGLVSETEIAPAGLVVVVVSKPQPLHPPAALGVQLQTSTRAPAIGRSTGGGTGLDGVGGEPGRCRRT